MKCGYQGGIQENKNILNEVIQNANVLRNEVNSYWTQLEEEGKEEVKHDYQLVSDNYVKMDNLIKSKEMSLQVFIQNYQHCENNPWTCKRINDAGIALIRSIYCKTYHLKEELYFNFKGSAYSFLSEAKRVMEEVRWELSLGARRSEYYNQEESEEEPIINIEKSFKYDECIICLTNLPNVLFCNYGHIAICEECDKMKSLNTCPICKTKSTIKRIVE